MESNNTSVAIYVPLSTDAVHMLACFGMLACFVVARLNCPPSARVEAGLGHIDTWSHRHSREVVLQQNKANISSNNKNEEQQ